MKIENVQKKKKRTHKDNGARAAALASQTRRSFPLEERVAGIRTGDDNPLRQLTRWN